jgi:hypothetical protein
MAERITSVLCCLLIPAFALGAIIACPAMSAEPDKPKPEQIDWGKEVNGLALSLSPAKGGQGRFLVRWKNVSKEALELPWVRFGSDPSYKHLDDLLNHVFVKKPDGELLPAREYHFPEIGGPPYRPRTVILAPGKVHEETIDLCTYLEKPPQDGRYQLWIDVDIRGSFAPSREGARYWTGKVKSNVLEVETPRGSANGSG